MPFELTQKFKRFPNEKVKLISLIAMTTSEERIKILLKGRRFYLHGYDECYYWRKWSVSPELKRKIELIKGVTDVPVLLDSVLEIKNM